MCNLRRLWLFCLGPLAYVTPKDFFLFIWLAYVTPKDFFLFIWLPFQSFLMKVQYTLAFAGVRLKHKKKVYGIIIIYVSHRVYSEKNIYSSL